MQQEIGMTDQNTTLTLNDDINVHHATRKKFDRVNAMLAAEYPACRVSVTTKETDHPDFKFEVARFNVEYNGEEVTSFEKAPSLEDVLGAVIEAGYDPQAEAEDEEEAPSGSVVAERYRVLYAEVSDNGRNCGDWLAEFLNGQVLDGDQKLMPEDFATLLQHNGVDLRTAKWANAYLTGTGARGWQGRFRMSGRVVLERIVAVKGVVYGVAGDEFPLPSDELEHLRSKHGEYLAKLKRAADKAAKAEQGEGA